MVMTAQLKGGESAVRDEHFFQRGGGLLVTFGVLALYTALLAGGTPAAMHRAWTVGIATIYAALLSAWSIVHFGEIADARALAHRTLLMTSVPSSPGLVPRRRDDGDW
jgi:hypothetical protein